MGNVVNLGSIAVSGGSTYAFWLLTTGATFSNTGSLTVEAGGTLDLQSPVTLAELQGGGGITVEAGGTLEIGGTLDLQGGTLALAVPPDNLVLTSGATVQNGTFIADGGALSLQFGRFAGITYEGELDLADHTSLSIQNGLTVENANGSFPGSILFGNYASLSVTGGLTVGASGAPGSIQIAGGESSLDFSDSETLDNAIVFLSGYGDSINSYGSTLTFGVNTALNLSGSYDSLNGSFINFGSISVTAGSAFTEDYYGAGLIDNQGSLRCRQRVARRF